uniref:Cation efflux protein transmembrane domain-containing protein n=1 Tax=Brassica campestris TaxID=3711 RepID=M4DPE9_BRACM
MELEHIRISKPDQKEEETESPSRIEEVIPLSCAFTRQKSLEILMANSLTVLTDAAHLLSDVPGLSVSLLAIKVSSWEANPRNSFGFKRLEVLAAFLSVQLIWLVSGVIIHEPI